MVVVVAVLVVVSEVLVVDDIVRMVEVDVTWTVNVVDETVTPTSRSSQTLLPLESRQHVPPNAM